MMYPVPGRRGDAVVGQLSEKLGGGASCRELRPTYIVYGLLCRNTWLYSKGS
jgi:hypothetical protein